MSWGVSMPKMAGTFFSETGGDLGSGSTKREATQRLGWFAIFLDGDRVLLRALNAAGIPTAISKVVSITSFLSHYLPDETQHSGVILPLLAQLKEKVQAAGEDLDESATPASLGLDKDETALFKALQIEEEYLPGLNAKGRMELALAMLQAPPEFHTVSVEHKRLANKQSIASRKDGRYDEAVELYNAMLRVAPEDSHILFNLARVHYDKSDHEACRQCLIKALEHDPDLKEARQFLDYLEKLASNDASSTST